LISMPLETSLYPPFSFFWNIGPPPYVKERDPCLVFRVRERTKNNSLPLVDASLPQEERDWNGGDL
jgi:hypothetical protein